MTTVPSLAKMAGQTPSEISNHREAMPDRAQTLRLFASYIRIPEKYESGLKKVGSRGAKLACNSRMWQRWRNRERVSQPISKGAMIKSEKPTKMLTKILICEAIYEDSHLHMALSTQMIYIRG